MVPAVLVFLEFDCTSIAGVGPAQGLIRLSCRRSFQPRPGLIARSRSHSYSVVLGQYRRHMLEVRLDDRGRQARLARVARNLR